jgi:hypothetical protein
MYSSCEPKLNECDILDGCCCVVSISCLSHIVAGFFILLSHFLHQQSIPWMVSPMGPMGILQGTLIYVGTSVVAFFELLQTKYSISPVVAGLVFCMIGVVGGMISIVLLTILSTPREKLD